MNAVHQHEYEIAWKTVLQHQCFVGGPEVEKFEEGFAAYCDATSCVGVANGTDALELILTGFGIGRGDEVIVPANTFIATAEAVSHIGATPVFVDCLERNGLMDTAAVGPAVTPRTTAVVPVHLYGQPVDMDALRRSPAHGLAVVEDACQAHGATYRAVAPAARWASPPPSASTRARTSGRSGTGGAVTGDTTLADRIRMRANHGRAAVNRHRHDQRGCNSRLDTLQAAMLIRNWPNSTAPISHAGGPWTAIVANFRAGASRWRLLRWPNRCTTSRWCGRRIVMP